MLEHLLQRRWSSAPSVVSALPRWSPIRIRCSEAAYFMKKVHHRAPLAQTSGALPAPNPTAAAYADALVPLMPLPSSLLLRGVPAIELWGPTPPTPILE
jgi:hypothetical protein